MIQVLRRLFLVIIWLNIIIFGGMTSFYAVTITRVTDDFSSVAAVIPLAIGASISLCSCLSATYFTASPTTSSVYHLKPILRQKKPRLNVRAIVTWYYSCTKGDAKCC